VKHMLFALLLLISVQGLAQGSVVMLDRPFQVDRKSDSGVLGRLERQTGYAQVHPRGKEVIYWINVLRKDPPAFHERYVRPFLQQFPEAGSPEAKSLARDLASIATLPELEISRVLVPAAQDHASFLAQKGTISHTGRAGKSFQKRMAEVGVEICAGENLFDGQDDALMSLILLLVDKGVPGTGHRLALLNPQFREIGVGISYMEKGRVVVVQQFSCKQ
jgi:Cysteine-rich secretory protein family